MLRRTRKPVETVVNAEERLAPHETVAIIFSGSGLNPSLPHIVLEAYSDLPTIQEAQTLCLATVRGETSSQVMCLTYRRLKSHDILT